MTVLNLVDFSFDKYTKFRGQFIKRDGTNLQVENYLLNETYRLSNELDEINPKVGEIIALIWIGEEFVLDKKYHTDLT